MTRDVTTIHADATLEEAAAMMALRDIGPLPVHDGEKLVGMLTDRDIVVRAVAAGADPIQDRVRNVMTPAVVYCFEDQGVQEAAGLMEQHKLRRLIVVDRDERLVGIISLGDLAVGTGEEGGVGEVLEVKSEPAEPER
jgi:CBS domain-containing protein